QALYAAGISPLPSGSHVYAFPENEYTTKKFWQNPKFEHIKFREKKRGDILYYQGHVSIYLGNGKMIEARSGIGKVVISPVRKNVIGVMRVFH
ncbi:MAG: C40 family peptidase, partial [Lachnospiraceae bacterium]|nr:C40 family peptidase [Lachnospiraceae bacterium]